MSSLQMKPASPYLALLSGTANMTYDPIDFFLPGTITLAIRLIPIPAPTASLAAARWSLLVSPTLGNRVRWVLEPDNCYMSPVMAAQN